MNGLGQDLGLRAGLSGREGHGGEAGDEHDADAGLAGGGDARHLDAVGTGHDDVGQQQVPGALVEGVDGVVAILAIDHGMARALERPGQEAAKRVIVFRQ